MKIYQPVANGIKGIHYYTDLVIPNVKGRIPMLIDTGASKSIIDLDIVVKMYDMTLKDVINLVKRSSTDTYTLITATKSKEVFYGIYIRNVSIGDVPIPIFKAYVNLDRSANNLLGMDFISNCELLISGSYGSCKLFDTIYNVDISGCSEICSLNNFNT